MRRRPQRPILVVTPSFRGGSWRRTEEALRRVADVDNGHGVPDARDHPAPTFLCVGYGPASTAERRRQILPAPHRVVQIPFGDYSQWHFLVQAPFLAVLVSLPLALITYVQAVLRRPHTIFANGLVAAFLVLPVAGLLRARLLVAHHGWVADVRGPAAGLTQLLGRRLDKIFVNSRGSARDLARLIPRDRLVVLEHNAAPIFFESHKPLDAWQGHDLGDRRVVLFVSRLDEEKNVDLLLQVIDDSVDDRSPTLFVIVGGGELRSEVEKRAQVAPDRVLYLGYVEDQELLARLYASADVFWGCGTATYLELPAVEALVTGTPILIPNRSSILGARRQGHDRVSPDLVPNNSGCLVEPKAAALGEALQGMLSGIEQGRYERRQIRDQARRRYGLGNMTPLLDALREGSDG